MTQTIIKDGKGSGRSAEVDDKNRVTTFSTVQSELVSATKTGNAYSISTSLITLTSSDESAVFYFKNNELSPIVSAVVVVEVGASTGGTGDVIQKNIISPTGGTIISDATPAIVSNVNITSSNTLAADAFIGGEGKTITGGASGKFIRHLSQTSTVTQGFIFPKGAVIASTFEPPTGNTSLNITLTLIVYLLDET